jgi:hypothetical protein
VKEQWRLSSVWGKVVRKGETLAGQLLLYMDERERERERWCSPAHRRPVTDVEHDRWSQGHTGFPCSESLTGGPQLGFEWWCESEAVSGCTVH